MARSLLWFLHTAAARLDSPTDAELLRRFAAGREEAAFELLVRRHAPAVWAACRNVLRNDADADDAFQATFLALARNAGSVRAGASLGGWLHRVATNAALKLRSKRSKTEPLPADVPTDPAADRDTGDTSVIHEELAGLSNAHRTTLVLVDLEGHTHTDAAKILGWPVGTVSGRLVRARAELKRRLERRGVTAPAVLVGGVVSGSTVRAAVGVAVGATVAPAAVVSLSGEVLAMIGSAKRKLVALTAAGLIGVAAVGTVGVMAYAQPRPDPARADRPKADDKPAAGWNEKGAYPSIIPDIKAEKLDGAEAYRQKLPEVVVMENDPPTVKAAKRRLVALMAQIDIMGQRVRVGQFSGGVAYQTLIAAASNVTEAADLIWIKPEQLLSWYEWRLSALKSAEWFIGQRVTGELETDPSTYPQLIAARYEAEIALLKLREKGRR